jgi:co-chaperonin GroES (HSP10)
MKKVIQGIGDKVICKILAEERTTKGGLFIPDGVAKNPQVSYEVITCGDEVKDIIPGDTIFCSPHGGMDIMVEDDIFKVLREEEIYGKLKEV